MRDVWRAGEPSSWVAWSCYLATSRCCNTAPRWCQRRLKRNCSICPPPDSKQSLSSMVSLETICGAWTSIFHGSNDTSHSLLVGVAQRRSREIKNFYNHSAIMRLSSHCISISQVNMGSRYLWSPHKELYFHDFLYLTEMKGHLPFLTRVISEEPHQRKYLTMIQSLIKTIL